ncbi:unnamed protein product [Diplocarpon coronariae]|uniref:2EXR domain-containing protein n=1 Tax=Diplocarpon coronariae TaxID=2795749 RepID=A0A218ZBX5_9HELO|nr:hypothetical protein B2J93_7976 [Marssonina coronariae]
MGAMDLHSSPPIPNLAFTLFPLLPLELRLQIYSEFNLLSPRVLSIKPTASRSETLKSYHLIPDLEGQPRFYYNPMLDTIHLTSSTKYAASSALSSTSTAPQDDWLLSLSQISSSLPETQGVYSLALRGVLTLPPANVFFESGGAKCREMLVLVGPGAHRRGASSYCGVGVGFMRQLLVREVERSLELMEGGFETGRAPALVALVGGGEGDEGLQERVLDERGRGLVLV